MFPGRPVKPWQGLKSPQSCLPLPQEYKELKGKGPFTVFVPHADLMTNLSRVRQPPGWGAGRSRPPAAAPTPAAGGAGPDPRPSPARVPLPRGGLPAAAQPGAAGGGLCHRAVRAVAALQREGGEPPARRGPSPRSGPTRRPCAPRTPSAVAAGDSPPPTVQLPGLPGREPSRLGPAHLSNARRDRTPPLTIPPRLPRPQGSIYINDYARVVSSDHEAVNGVLHFIDRVLLPPDALHWEPGAAPAPRVCPGRGPGARAAGQGLTPLLTSTFPQRNVTAAAESFGYKSFSRLVRVLPPARAGQVGTPRVSTWGACVAHTIVDSQGHTGLSLHVSTQVCWDGYRVAGVPGAPP